MTKLIKPLLVIIIIFIGAAANSQAGFIEETAIQTNTLTREGQKRIDQISNNPFLRKIYPVRLGSLKKLQKDGAITFSLPGYKAKITAYSKYVEHENDDNYTWHGDILDKVGSIIGTMSYIVDKGSSYGTIKLEGKLFQIEDMGLDKNGRDRLHLILEMDQEKLAEQSCNVSEPLEDKTLTENTISSKQNCSGSPIVKILVLYTQNAQNTGFNPNSQASLGITDLNQAIRNSGITASQLTFQLAGVIKLNGFTETSNINSDRERLRDNTPSAQNLRNHYNADLVVLYAENPSYTAGGNADINTNADPTKAYAIVKINQSPKTFEHEVGHLLGGRHENEVGGYDRGYSYFENASPFTARKTIMWQSSLQTIDHFSNPIVNFNGNPTGIANSRDVVRRIKTNACAISQFRIEPVPSFSIFFGGDTQIYPSTAPFSWCLSNVYGCAVVTTGLQWRYSNDGFNYSQFATGNCGYRTYSGFSPMAYTVYVKLTATCSASGVVASRVRALHNWGANNYSSKRGNEDVELPIAEVLPELLEPDVVGVELSQNPIQNSVSVTVNVSGSERITFSIWDATGRQVQTFVAKSYDTGTTVETLKLNGLTNGLYYLKVTGGPDPYSLPFLINP